MRVAQRNSLIVAGALLLLGLAAMFTLMPTDAEVYRNTKSGLALKNILQNQIAPNNSNDEVRALVGDGSIEHVDADHS